MQIDLTPAQVEAVRRIAAHRREIERSIEQINESIVTGRVDIVDEHAKAITVHIAAAGADALEAFGEMEI